MSQATGAGQVPRQHFLVESRELGGRPLLTGQRASRAVVFATCGREGLFGRPVALLDVGHPLGQRIDGKGINQYVHQECRHERHDHAAVLGNGSPHQRHAVKVFTHGRAPWAWARPPAPSLALGTFWAPSLASGTSRGGGMYVPSIAAWSSPSSPVRSSVVNTPRKPPVFS